jgi:hypothetical protein
MITYSATIICYIYHMVLFLYITVLLVYIYFVTSLSDLSLLFWTYSIALNYAPPPRAPPPVSHAPPPGSITCAIMLEAYCLIHCAILSFVNFAMLLDQIHEITMEYL